MCILLQFANYARRLARQVAPGFETSKMTQEKPSYTHQEQMAGGKPV